MILPLYHQLEADDLRRVVASIRSAAGVA
jgi:hypothetical protein